ncbi:PREDICTED: uncharacterized protein LOC105539051 [Mandrillus leucophaeus]|uniref:uncharacterized protein LOC105539051 n=1 Tax=Mandrillus leucophaeus TaxID=9568 RepID=UPI0005F3DFDA|nr:PREDICTED: uncharacterized protein LOC105539051 [Mandrillus leucophaeus]
MEQQVCGRRGPGTRSSDASVENTFYFATWSPSYPRAYEQPGNYFGGYQQRDLEILEIGKNKTICLGWQRESWSHPGHSLLPLDVGTPGSQASELGPGLTPSAPLVIHHQLSWFFTFRQQTVGLLDLHFQFPK